MTLQQAQQKHFNLEKHLIDRSTLCVPVRKWHVSYAIIFSGIVLGFALIPLVPSLCMLVFGLSFLLGGIVILKDSERLPDQKNDAVSNIFFGCLLFGFLAYMTFLKHTNYFGPIRFETRLTVNLIFFMVVFVLKVLIMALSLNVEDRLRKKRCSLPITATCIGVFERKTLKGKQYFPVWEYGIGKKTTVVDQDSVIPVSETEEIKEIYRNGDDYWANVGDTRFGMERLLYVNPQKPWEVCYHAVPSSNPFRKYGLLWAIVILFSLMMVLIIIRYQIM